jgi:hypothetical protein
MQRLTLLSLVSFVAPLALAAQQPTNPPAPPAAPAAAHDTVRGAVRTVDARARTLEVVTGVGLAIRLVRLDVPADVPITAAGVATLALGDLKPGDVVAVSFGIRTAKSVAYSIQRVGRMETGPEPPR